MVTSSSWSGILSPSLPLIKVQEDDEFHTIEDPLDSKTA